MTTEPVRVGEGPEMSTDEDTATPAKWSTMHSHQLMDEARRILDEAGTMAEPMVLIAVAQVYATAAQVQATNDLHWTIDNLMRSR